MSSSLASVFEAQLRICLKASYKFKKLFYGLIFKNPISLSLAVHIQKLKTLLRAVVFKKPENL